jgi:hypothetical protein
MADIIDMANDKAMADTDRAIAAARHDLAPGVPGECERCGEHSPRLVGGACAPCRDKWRLP